jgi:hypothetical protein
MIALLSFFLKLLVLPSSRRWQAENALRQQVAICNARCAVASAHR